MSDDRSLGFVAAQGVERGVDLAALALDRQQTGIAVLDTQHEILAWNRWIADWTGVSAAQALRRRLDDLFPELAGGELVATLRQVAQGGAAHSWSQPLDPERIDAVETAMTPGDREQPLFRISMAPVPLAGGRGSLLEIVEAPFLPWRGSMVSATRRPVDGSHRARLDEGADVAIIAIDARGRITTANAEFCALTGFAAEELRAAPVRLVFPDLAHRAMQPLVAQLRTQASTGLLRVATAAGDNRWLIAVAGTPDDAPEGLLLACRDVGPLVTESSQAQLRAEQVAALMMGVADAVILLDAQGLIASTNPLALEMLGVDASSLSGEAADARLRFVPVERGTPPFSVRAALAAGSAQALPTGLGLQRADGETVPVAGTLAPLRDGENKLAGGILVLRAGGAVRRESQRLAWQAEHDALTGLPNRLALARAISAQLERLHRGGRGGALVYIDLANFSLVNDTCGHLAGDSLLRQVSRLLASVIHAGDLLARVGNDEFAVLLRDADAATAEAMIRTLLGDFFGYTFPWGERRIKVGINLGYALVDRGIESDIDVLVTAAANCVKAKELGRNRAHYPVGKGAGARGDGFAEWIPRISAALDEQRFQLFFQPIVSLGNPAGSQERNCEALIRMVDRDGQLISPQSFIPAAERYGLIDDIDRWVVAEALATLQRLSKRQLAGFKLSVNLSGATISDESAADFILGLIDRSGIDPRHLQFEITETAAIRQFDRALALIHRLRGHGCYLALDDFGSGLSSLRYLQEIPVDFLKIDGAFIRRIELSDVEHAMVDTINHLAHIMGIRTVAESVENATQLGMLRQLGVDYAQGFHIAMPQTIEGVFAVSGTI